MRRNGFARFGYRQLFNICFLTTILAGFGRCTILDNGAKVPQYVTDYAPVLRLHSEDPFRPSDILEHIRHTTPAINFEPIDSSFALDLDNLEMLNKYGEEVALTSVDDVLKLPQWLLGELPDETGEIRNSTASCIILVEKSVRDVDVFYFYFYSFDRGANISQVLEPLDSLFDLNDTQKSMHYGNHVGDWENNMIRFRDGEPQGIYYSQHVSGKIYSWDDPMLSKEAGRPIVYSAYGSHANYATLGNHVHDKVLVDYCDDGPRWDPTQSAYFYHLDPKSFKLTRLFLSSEENASTNYTSFFYFNGRWGDTQYPDSDSRQETIPYFGLKRFQTGPTGPRSKQLVRIGLFPDHQHVEGWVEWGVGVYMSWYPCCLNGWRVYVTLIVIFGLVVMVVVSIAITIRRSSKRRKYSLLDTNIPLLDRVERTSLDSAFSEDRPVSI